MTRSLRRKSAILNSGFVFGLDLSRNELLYLPPVRRKIACTLLTLTPKDHCINSALAVTFHGMKCRTWFSLYLFLFCFSVWMILLPIQLDPNLASFCLNVLKYSYRHPSTQSHYGLCWEFSPIFSQGVVWWQNHHLNIRGKMPHV